LTLARTPYADHELARAAHRLGASQASGGGWEYNANWPIDADTIANVLLFLAGRAAVKRSAWAPALDILLAHQHADGGFRTFADAEAWSPHLDTDAHGLRGWTGIATLCHGGRRAAAGQTLLKPLPLAAADALEYLRAQQRRDGSWDAYW
jgi:squalene cyclase